MGQALQDKYGKGQQRMLTANSDSVTAGEGEGIFPKSTLSNIDWMPNLQRIKNVASPMAY